MLWDLPLGLVPSLPSGLFPSLPPIIIMVTVDQDMEPSFFTATLMQSVSVLEGCGGMRDQQRNVFCAYYVERADTSFM